IDFDQPHQLFGGAGVQLAPAIGRVDEGAGTEFRKMPSHDTRNFAKKMRNAAERQIVSLDMVVDCHPGELRHQTKVSADQSLDKAGTSKAIEAAIGAIPR